MRAQVSPRERWKADGALLFITAFWGVTFVVVKDAHGHSDAYSFIALRFAVGAAVLTVLARRSVLKRENLQKGALLSLFLLAGFLLQTLGLERTTPSRSAFITGLCVILVPFITLVVFRRVPRVASLFGVGLACAGLYVLTAPAGGEAGLTTGDLLTLGAALAYAIHISLTERFAPDEGAIGLVAVQLWGVALGAAACLPFVEAHVEWTPAYVGAFLFCGLFASAMAISIQTWAQARTTAVRAALVYALEPVFAAAYSVALGYERLGGREAAGGALIIVGVLVAEAGPALWSRVRASRAAHHLG